MTSLHSGALVAYRHQRHLIFPPGGLFLCMVLLFVCLFLYCFVLFNSPELPLGGQNGLPSTGTNPSVNTYLVSLALPLLMPKGQNKPHSTKSRCREPTNIWRPREMVYCLSLPHL